jgi:hypothetical protein
LRGLDETINDDDCGRLLAARPKREQKEEEDAFRYAMQRRTRQSLYLKIKIRDLCDFEWE